MVDVRGKAPIFVIISWIFTMLLYMLPTYHIQFLDSADVEFRSPSWRVKLQCLAFKQAIFYIRPPISYSRLGPYLRELLIRGVFVDPKTWFRHLSFRLKVDLKRLSMQHGKVGNFFIINFSKFSWIGFW